ncbi:MAG: (d)CMP kinase [Gemmatimonas sp.]
MANPVVIAIDGPAASGKGTLARRLARHLGYAYLETGRLYRAVAAKVLDAGFDPADEAAAARVAQGLVAADLEHPKLFEPETTAAASTVAAHGAVRAALLQRQRDFAVNPPGGAPGVVVDGRDIGTHVFPGADHKIYLAASPDIRAERRVAQLREQGREAIYQRVLADIQDRDRRDETRRHSPLARAKDAHLLDTSTLDADQVFNQALTLIAADPNPAD